MKQRTNIEIDLEVHKAIVKHSNYINEPPNDVLRRLLVTDEIGAKEIAKTDSKGGLMVKGIYLKNGLRLRKHFKGKLFEATVKDGFLEFGNKKYTSPSGAAVKAAGNAVNGWRFWDYFDDNDQKWKMLETLRS